MTALFAALACVATMSIRIPTPGTSGYIHPGDAIVILAGIILGPVYGMLAGGIGSALSDLIGGYFVYVPITLVIKGLVALVSGLIYQKMCRSGKNRYIHSWRYHGYRIRCRRIFYLRILPLWKRCCRKYSCQYHPGNRRTDYLCSIISCTDRDPGCPPGCLRGEKLTSFACFTIYRICHRQFLSNV